VPTSEDLGHRLWRMRRRHDQIDAVLRPTGQGWELTYSRNQRPMLVWRYASRDDAVADADARRRELERAGWTAHW